MIRAARAGGFSGTMILYLIGPIPSMLDVLRRGASTWVSKLLLSLLIVSFGVWGIADVFRGFGSNTAYRIGSTEIGVVELDNAYGRELRQVSQRAGRPVNKDEALRSGLSQQILSKIVTEATLRNAASDLHLGVSDETIGKEIVADPSFKSVSGAFDRNRFVDILRNNGLNEAYYVAQRREEILRNQLMDAVAGNIVTSQAFLEALDQFRNETRTVRMTVISAATLGEIAAPSDADLAAFYEQRKAAFRAVENRTVVVLKLDAAAIARPQDVSDDDAKAEYEREKARFGTPEKRRVLQIAFDDAAQAEAAVAEIKSGKSFEEIARARGIDDKDLDLGLMAKTAFLDPKIAEASFALPSVGATSGVVAGRARPVVLKLAEVVAGTQKPYAEVAADLKLEIAKKRAEGDTLTLHDQIEDALAGGAKLADVAARFHIQPVTLAGLTHDGTLADGSKPDLPQLDKLVTGAFESDVGVENDPIDLSGRGFMWYAVTAIDPAHDRPLAEVKDKALAAWKAEEVSKKLAAAADGVKERLSGKATFEEAVAPIGATVTTTQPFRRGEAPEGMTPAAVAAAFAGPEGHFASVPGNGEDRIVLQVASVTPSVYFPGTDVEKELSAKVAGSMRFSVLEDYVRAEQKLLGVTANPQVIGRVTGRSKD